MTVEVNRDGTYEIVYDGTVVHALIRAAWQEDNADPTLAAAELALVKELNEDEHFTRAVPMGKGRFRVRWEKTGKLAGRTVYCTGEMDYVVKIVPRDWRAPRKWIQAF